MTDGRGTLSPMWSELPLPGSVDQGRQVVVVGGALGNVGTVGRTTQ